MGRDLYVSDRDLSILHCVCVCMRMCVCEVETHLWLLARAGGGGECLRGGTSYSSETGGHLCRAVNKHTVIRI